MITSQDFDRAVYRPPRLKDDRPMISNIVGIDSEAYTSGVPFILATSHEDVFDPVFVPECFFENPVYHNVNFVVWNLKYDSGAILYFLDRDKMEYLWKNGKVSLFRNDLLYRFEYIPHKLLRITHKKIRVSFWDISQFFKTSLDQASQKYLGESKTRMQTKNFTPKYFKRYRKHVIKYCIRDAQLTQRLAQFALDKFEEFGIITPSLYSCASVSFKYFCDHTKVVSVYHYWKNDRRLLAYAADAYEGGKFEVTTRGAFHGYEYDLTSAYPYEIANLVDITRAETLYSSTYQPDAVYGFLRCHIDNDIAAHLPCGPMINNIRIYPTGSFYLTITKAEYEYLTSINVKVSIISAVWLFVKRRRYPYRKAIMHLFAIKDSYKNKDPMSYSNAKIVLNSFYGKMAQSVETPEGKVHIGAGWNPIYASVITANTRLQVTKIQNIMKSDCLAVHTDSVIVKKPLPSDIPLNGLGKFEYVTEGDGIIIACGMYQIGNLSAFKGFKPRTDETWTTLLSRFPNRKTIPYKILHVESWVESMAKNHLQNRINVFAKSKKLMDLNCDRKRIWEKPFKAKDFLISQQESFHKIYIENEPPKYFQ